MPLTFKALDDMADAVERGLILIPTEGESENIRQTLIKSLGKNPLLYRYSMALQAGNNAFRCTLPWHGQGDRLGAALTALIVPIIHKDGSSVGRSVAQTAAGVSMQILAAQVYLWAEETLKVAWDMPVPRHTIAREQLPYPLMFFSYEVPLPIRNSDPAAETNWFLIAHAPTRIWVFHDYAQAGGGVLSWADIRVGSIPYGAIYPTDFPEEEIGPASKILAMLAFINSPFVDTTPQRMPRPIRRELERNGDHRTANVWDTNVVTLRRKLYSPDSPDSPEGEGEEREWSSRWWVSGHIRAQWYPSLKAHKLIWIAPYIKGPEDKPVQSKTYMVTR